MRNYSLLSVLCIFLLVVGCKKDKIVTNDKPVVPTMSDTLNRHAKIPVVLAQEIEDAFESNSMKRIEDSIVQEQQMSYKITAASFKTMMNEFLAANDSDTLYFIPIQVKDAFFDKALSPFLNQLYLMYAYGKNETNTTGFDVESITPVDGSFHTFLDTSDIVDIPVPKGRKFNKNYRENIRPVLNPADNTRYIKIYKQEIVDYKTIWDGLNIQPDTLQLNWAENPSSDLIKRNKFDSGLEARLLETFGNFKEGTVTFTIDAYHNMQLISELSNYDMNTICPDDCP